MLCKNDIYETEITSYTAEGSGVCRINNIAVFVPNTVVGDRLKVRIVKVCKTYAYGKTEQMISESANRISPVCSAFGQCGGCGLMHMSYDEQINFKYGHVKDCIKRIGGIDTDVLPPLRAEKLYGYRNKVQVPVGSDLAGNIITGFYSQRSHRVVKADMCSIQSKSAQKIITAVTDWMNEYDITPYSEETHSGIVRHIYIRNSEPTGEIMTVLVINAAKLPHTDILADRMKALGVTSLAFNINKNKTNVILGNKTVNIYGGGKITDILCGLKFEISPQSFYQVNHDQAEKLYDTAISFAGLTKNDTVLDLYCGTGTITLYAAGFAKKAIGIEIIPEAIENAKTNMKLNNIRNADFYCGDAGEVTKKLADKGIKVNKIIVDPPRKGCSEETLKLIAELKPEKVVYVSCNPATLARDLKIMQTLGYRTEKVQPVDMFVHSPHIESVALLVPFEN